MLYQQWARSEDAITPFPLLKDTPDQKEVLKIYRKEHSAYKAMEVYNSSYSKIWSLLTKVKKVIQAGLTNLHN